MKCHKCGKEFPSLYYFKAPGVCNECYEKLTPEEQRDPLDFEPGLNVIMVIGVNGSGKTTSIGKLSNYFMSQGKKELALADYNRAKALDPDHPYLQRKLKELEMMQ